MQLQASLEQYRKQGLGVAAISYDSVDILKNFADRMHITYPMLSDKDSATIKAFGILNAQVPQTSAQYGIPHPGMYIVDRSGKILARYFEEKYQERFTPDTILTKQFGGGTSAIEQIKTEHLTLALSQSQVTARPGNRVTLIADITLPARMHVYAPGVKGYTATAMNLDASPMIQVHPAQFPKPQVLMLPAIKERVPVFERQLRITRDVTILSSVKAPDIELSGTFEYQACDDSICYVPKKVPLKFSIHIEGLETQRVPEALRKKAP